MRIIIIVTFGLIFTGAVQAQVGSSISADGTTPNVNAMLDVQSPASGDGKGILIPRVTLAQRTTPDADLAGGLLDISGNLRGGGAQGLIVYQTDGDQGLYFNTSLIATPAWVYLGNSTTNYLPLTGGTMSGALNMGAQIVTNVAHIDFNGNTVSVGRGANGNSFGAAVGRDANGYNTGAAVGRDAYGYNTGAALGYMADGSWFGAAMGNAANGTNYGAAVGRQANGFDSGAAMGYQAASYSYGAAVGREATGTTFGAAMGYQANGSWYGAAIGNLAKGTNYGAAVGSQANGSFFGAAIGEQANGYASGAALGWLANGYGNGAAVGREAVGTNYGAALGNSANGSGGGAAVGYQATGTFSGAAVGQLANGSGGGAGIGYLANGSSSGAALGREANGTDFGVALGRLANGSKTNVAIGALANAQGGTQQIAIGNNVTNDLPNTARIRGTLYLDGGTGVMVRASFGGAGAWTAKTFEIDHPLDPANKVLRHYCLEGPQVWNVYAGNAQLVNGQAVVELPEYYSALNLVGSEIYSLTVVDKSASQFPLVKVAEEVADNRFVIAGTLDVKVSWTIKVLRNDPGCLEDLRRRPVEQLKRDIR